MTREELIDLIRNNYELIADYIGTVDIKKLENVAKLQEKARLETQIPDMEAQIANMKSRLIELKK